MNGFWDLKCTNEHTDERTNTRTEANLKVPTVSGGGPKRFPVIIRSNGSKNIDFELFLVIFTQHDPLKWAKIWSHGAAWQTKILKKYSTKNISYKKKNIKKYRVNIRSNLKRNWVFFGRKWPNFGCFWPKKPILAKKGQFWFFDKKAKQTIFHIYKAKVSWEKSEKSDASLWKYEQKTLILGYFGPFLAKKGPILNFRQKTETAIFLHL